MAYTILINSSSDLPQEIVDQFQLRVAPLKFVINNEIFPNYLDYHNLPVKDFYQRLRNGEMATTSQLNTVDYEEIIQEEFHRGNDVLILSFSSALSGSYNSARLAVEAMSGKKHKVLLVDTKAASLGEGLIVYLAALQKQAGKTIDEVYHYVEELKLHIAHWFTVDDLMFLKRGGRVSGASAIVGSMLSIKPVLHVDNEGKLIPRLKVMGRKKAIQSLVDKVKETVDTSISNVVFISHADDEETALKTKEKILELGLGLDVKVVHYIGPVIGAHSGPGTIAVFFAATHR
ncbi:MAG: DegV family protein [Candidatus Izemoplasmatales bacterium]|nr:DegV family protein [Candidatus Izemoplasmatales bacterium]